MKSSQSYTIGASEVKVSIGDILHSNAQVFVSSDDDHFTMRGGVSKTLRTAAGERPMAELADKAGKSPVGTVAVTSAGGLTKQAHIFHAVTRQRGSKRELITRAEIEQTINKIISRSLGLLDNLELYSIAFPALGTGFAGFGPKEVAVVMAETLTDRLSAHPKNFNVEIILHPDSFAENVDFIDFFRQFDAAAGWTNKVIRDHALIFIHGIRTEANWFTSAARVFRSYDHTLNPVSAGYEVFDLFRFLMPFRWAKKSALKRVEDSVLFVQRHENTKYVSIIAHSFGTYLVGELIKNNPSIKIHRIILCGSVLPQKFDWTSAQAQLTAFSTDEYPTQCVLNDCGWHDIWPVLARTCTWGYGPSGRFGFQQPMVLDRFHNLSHSGFFDDDFVKNYWCNHISAGRVAASPELPPHASWVIKTLTTIKFPYLVIFSLVIILIII